MENGKEFHLLPQGILTETKALIPIHTTKKVCEHKVLLIGKAEDRNTLKHRENVLIRNEFMIQRFLRCQWAGPYLGDNFPEQHEKEHIVEHLESLLGYRLVPVKGFQ